MPPRLILVFGILFSVLGSVALLRGSTPDINLLIGFFIGILTSITLLFFLFRDRHKRITYDVSGVSGIVIALLIVVGLPSMVTASGTQFQNLFHGYLAISLPVLLMGVFLIQGRK